MSILKQVRNVDKRGRKRQNRDRLGDNIAYKTQSRQNRRMIKSKDDARKRQRPAIVCSKDKGYEQDRKGR